jgi:hypothetical protein
MKLRFAIAALAICVVTVALYVTERRRLVEFSDLKFELSEKTIRYAFSVHNLETRDVALRVQLVAHDAIGQGTRVGSGILGLGRTAIEIALAPRETRRLSGSFQLSNEPQGTLLLTPEFELLKSNDLREPTA